MGVLSMTQGLMSCHVIFCCSDGFLMLGQAKKKKQRPIRCLDRVLRWSQKPQRNDNIKMELLHEIRVPTTYVPQKGSKNSLHQFNKLIGNPQVKGCFFWKLGGGYPLWARAESNTWCMILHSFVTIEITFQMVAARL